MNKLQLIMLRRSYIHTNFYKNFFSKSLVSNNNSILFLYHQIFSYYFKTFNRIYLPGLNNFFIKSENVIIDNHISPIGCIYKDKIIIHGICLSDDSMLYGEFNNSIYVTCLNYVYYIIILLIRYINYFKLIFKAQSNISLLALFKNKL
jgi:hypothetical protein